MTIMHSPHYARSRTYINSVSRIVPEAVSAGPVIAVLELPVEPPPVVRAIIHVSKIKAQKTFSGLIQYVCRSVGIDLNEMTSARKTLKLARLRQVLCWVGRNCFKRSLNQIGRDLKRDHSTVLNSAQKIDRLIAERGLVVPADAVAAALYLNRELGGVQ